MEALSVRWCTPMPKFRRSWKHLSVLLLFALLSVSVLFSLSLKLSPSWSRLLGVSSEACLGTVLQVFFEFLMLHWLAQKQERERESERGIYIVYILKVILAATGNVPWHLQVREVDPQILRDLSYWKDGIDVNYLLTVSFPCLSPYSIWTFHTHGLFHSMLLVIFYRQNPTEIIMFWWPFWITSYTIKRTRFLRTN